MYRPSLRFEYAAHMSCCAPWGKGSRCRAMAGITRRVAEINPPQVPKEVNVEVPVEKEVKIKEVPVDKIVERDAAWILKVEGRRGMSRVPRLCMGPRLIGRQTFGPRVCPR